MLIEDGKMDDVEISVKEMFQKLKIIFKYTKEIQKYTETIPEFEDPESDGENENSDEELDIDYLIKECNEIQAQYEDLYTPYSTELEKLYEKLSYKKDYYYEGLKRLLPKDIADVVEDVLEKFERMQYYCINFNGASEDYPADELGTQLNRDIEILGASYIVILEHESFIVEKLAKYNK